MHSTLQHARVLSISYDPWLLKTRQMVFGTCCNAVSLDTLDGMHSLAAVERFNLLLLCHSLPPEDAEWAIRYARNRWPGIKVVGLTAAETSRCESVDHCVRGLDGPRVLLGLLERLQVV